MCGGGGGWEHNSDRTENRDEVGKNASWENCNFDVMITILSAGIIDQPIVLAG